MDSFQSRTNSRFGYKRESATSSPLLSDKRGPRSLSALSLSARSTSTAQIASHSEFNVEPYGLPFPVQVREALTFGSKSTSVSVNCSKNGWAWAVAGRKLYAWLYKEPKSVDGITTPQRRTISSQCRILTLPHCDIGHKAELVTVFVTEGYQMASCLAVSPTGDVRFWSSIAHDGSSIDETGIMEGEEFDQMLYIPPMGYLLFTTTCHMVQLQLKNNGGRQSIIHRVIKPPSGFFGAIGKKLASVVIGLQSSGEKENKLIKVCSEVKEEANYTISVLADHWLTRWTFSPSQGETFLFEEIEVLKKIREFYMQRVWKNRDLTDLKMWLLDMQAMNGNLVVLSAAINLASTPTVEYALLTFQCEKAGLKTISGHNLRHKGVFSAETEKDVLSYKFIGNRGIAYIYDEKTIHPIVVLNVPEPVEDAEKIELKSPEDRIISGITIDHSALFFTRVHGMVAVSPSDFESGDFYNSSMSPDVLSIGGPPLTDTSLLGSQAAAYAALNNLTMYAYDPQEIMETSNADDVSQVKAAFIYHLKKNAGACKDIVDSLLEEDADGRIDRVVVTIAKDIAEDMPAADPRWNVMQGEETHPLGSSTSMQIIQQLKDKSLAFGQFIGFLHTVGIWTRLTTTIEHGSTRPTHQILTDIAEKLVAAIALKSVHSKFAHIVDDAIEQVLVERKLKPMDSLTNQDMFYVKTTHIHALFGAFAKQIETLVAAEDAPARVHQILLDISTVVLTILHELITFRESKAPQFATPPGQQEEKISWTALSGRHGALDSLLQIVQLNIKHGVKFINAIDLRQKFFLQHTDLVDFLFDDQRRHLESVNDPEKRRLLLQKYETLRSDLIQPLIDGEQYELAAKLAEKYLDFQTLVLICDRTDNQPRLDAYNERFKADGFPDFAINWHLRQNKQKDIFDRFKHDPAVLSKFLGDHPSLAWIQLFFNGEFDRASRILFSLAQNERELVSRKRTMLSLAKLSAVAAATATTDPPLNLAEIDAELNLIKHQEHLPEDLLLSFGYDLANPKVMTPEEIVNLYIAEENFGANEEDFRKALELLMYAENPEECRLKIWTAAILRDSWTDYNPDAPLDDLQNMLFFKLIELCFLLDGELSTFLPPIEYFLKAPELGELKDDKEFQYLLKLGYEHINDSYKSKMQE